MVSKTPETFSSVALPLQIIFYKVFESTSKPVFDIADDPVLVPDSIKVTVVTLQELNREAFEATSEYVTPSQI